MEVLANLALVERNLHSQAGSLTSSQQTLTKVCVIANLLLPVKALVECGVLSVQGSL